MSSLTETQIQSGLSAAGDRDAIIAQLEQVQGSAIAEMRQAVDEYNEALRAATFAAHQAAGGTDPEHRVHNKYAINLRQFLVTYVGSDTRLGSNGQALADTGHRG